MTDDRAHDHDDDHDHPPARTAETGDRSEPPGEHVDGPMADTSDVGPQPTTGDRLDDLSRRMNLLVGALAVLLVGAFVVIGLLFARVADAEQDADTARSELADALGGGLGDVSTDELAQLRDDLERVEAGAALYASQVEGFQEQLTELEPQVSAGIDEAISGLREFGDSTISFDLAVDEVIPVQTDIVIDRVIEVPIQTSIPINQSFDTTIQVALPLGDVPLDVTVPVDVEVPVDLVVEIPINETVAIDEEFPVQLDVPISIEVRETELANLTDSLAAGLESLRDVLTGLG